ncbi:hypothetical protein BDV09DRAFT_173813 [Aspergillus tetrazonus]
MSKLGPSFLSFRHHETRLNTVGFHLIFNQILLFVSTTAGKAPHNHGSPTEAAPQSAPPELLSKLPIGGE